MLTTWVSDASERMKTISCRKPLLNKNNLLPVKKKKSQLYRLEKLLVRSSSNRRKSLSKRSRSLKMRIKLAVKESRKEKARRRKKKRTTTRS